MHFANPKVVYFLLLPLSLMLFYFLTLKWRRNALGRLAEWKLIGNLTQTFDARKWKRRAAVFVGFFLFAILSLMRPEWGSRWEEVKRKGIDIVIALDTSQSMFARDIKPNRLQRSKLAIEDLTRQLKGDRIGLVAFAGSAFLQCPLTVDYNGFLLSLADIDADTIPRGGTSISSAIKEAIRGYEGGLKKNKAMVIITDGEDHEGDAVKAAEKARDAGIKIFCVGIGTKEGELIPFTDSSGKKRFLKDKNGNVVKTRLDEDTLKKIASITGGAYLGSTSREFGLELLYREKLSKLEKNEFSSEMKEYKEQRYQLPLGIALILLMAGMFITDRKQESIV